MKTLTSKYILLVVTGIVEILFLCGVMLNKDGMIAWGIVGLVLAATTGIFYIGVESILVMHRDLNTKQSYMLFLTPNSSYKILGAKILENGMAIFLTGIAYGILAIADITFLILKLDGLQQLLDFVDMMLTQMHMEIHITRVQGFLGLFGALSGWLIMIVNGYLAVVLAATFLAGKKFSGLVSFLFYIGIGIAENRILSFIPDATTLTAELGVTLAANFVMIIVVYILIGWIMDKKLSV